MFNAGRGAVRETGGVLVILIHGAYTSPWHWHRVVPLLEAVGCEVVVPELPCDDPDAGIDAYVAAVEAALGSESGDSPLVVGSSLGAVTACVFATAARCAGSSPSAAWSRARADAWVTTRAR